MRGKHAVIIYNDTAAFLPPVLQRIQSVIANYRRIDRLLGNDPEDTALFMNTHNALLFYFPLSP